MSWVLQALDIPEVAYSSGAVVADDDSTPKDAYVADYNLAARAGWGAILPR